MIAKSLMVSTLFLSFGGVALNSNLEHLEHDQPFKNNKDSLWGFNSDGREFVDIKLSNGDTVKVLDVGGLAYLGDMILGETEELIKYGLDLRDVNSDTFQKGRVSAQAHTIYPSSGKLWPNGVVPYVLDSSLGPNAKSAARDAIRQWNAKTNLQFVPRSNEFDYISISGGRSCSSWVGKSGGKQKVILSELCGLHAALHELGHAVGFFHEHTRADRDSFVQINRNNIVRGMEYNFEEKSLNEASPEGPYDYYSIMHYPANAFTKNGYNTIVPLDGGIDVGYMGYGLELSPGDIEAANSLYSNYTPPKEPEKFQGTLTQSGDSDIQIDGTYFDFLGGELKATLNGPSYSNFNLYLYKWNSSHQNWVLTASSANGASQEFIHVDANQGSYYFLVYSMSGSGQYELEVER